MLQDFTAALGGTPNDQLQQVVEAQNRLIDNKWKREIGAIHEAFSKKDRTVEDHTLRQVAQLLENTNHLINSIHESNRNSALGTFVDYGLDIVTGVAPNLIANELVSVQAMNARNSTIFYLDYLYGTNKGGITKGSKLQDAQVGRSSAQYSYTGEEIESEVIGVGDGATTTFSTTLAFFPLRALDGVMKIYDDGTEVGQVDSALAFTGAALTTGSCSLNLTTGAIVLEWAVAPVNLHSLTFSYVYDMYESTVGIPEVDIQIRDKSIEARPRKLRANWLIDTAFAFGKEHGRDLDADIQLTMANQIKWEIDAHLLSEMYKGAGMTGYTFSKAHPKDPTTANYGLKAHYEMFCDVLNEAANDIYKVTKRTQPNWLVTGKNGAIVIEGLGEDRFKRASIPAVADGPHFIGVLDGKYKVYKNPYYGDTQWLLGHRGQSYMDAGFIYAPFMPVVTVRPNTGDDFISRRGIATSYGTLMANSLMYAKGTVTA